MTQTKYLGEWDGHGRPLVVVSTGDAKRLLDPRLDLAPGITGEFAWGPLGCGASCGSAAGSGGIAAATGLLGRGRTRLAIAMLADALAADDRGPMTVALADGRLITIDSEFWAIRLGSKFEREGVRRLEWHGFKLLRKSVRIWAGGLIAEIYEQQARQTA